MCSICFSVLCLFCGFQIASCVSISVNERQPKAVSCFIFGSRSISIYHLVVALRNGGRATRVEGFGGTVEGGE